MKIQQKRYFTLSIIIISISIVLSFSLATIILFLLFQFNFLTLLNPSRIYLPEGNELHQLHRFSYKNHELARYSSNLLVLNEDDEEEEMEKEWFMDFMGQYSWKEDIDYEFMDVYPYTEDHHSVKCSGTCSCYDVSEEHDRRLANMVYSNRYISTFGIAVLGWATAKFVNNHIDECYTNARIILGDSAPIVCAFDEDKEGVVECDELIEDLLGKNKFYYCEGNCRAKNMASVNMEQADPYALEVIEKCESLELDSHVIMADNMKKAHEEFLLVLHNFCTHEFHDPNGETMNKLNEWFLKSKTRIFCLGSRLHCDGPENNYGQPEGEEE